MTCVCLYVKLLLKHKQTETIKMQGNISNKIKIACCQSMHFGNYHNYLPKWVHEYLWIRTFYCSLWTNFVLQISRHKPLLLSLSHGRYLIWRYVFLLFLSSYASLVRMCVIVLSNDILLSACVPPCSTANVVLSTLYMQLRLRHDILLPILRQIIMARWLVSKC